MEWVEANVTRVDDLVTSTRISGASKAMTEPRGKG